MGGWGLYGPQTPAAYEAVGGMHIISCIAAITKPPKQHIVSAELLLQKSPSCPPSNNIRLHVIHVMHDITLRCDVTSSAAPEELGAESTQQCEQLSGELATATFDIIIKKLCYMHVMNTSPRLFRGGIPCSVNLNTGSRPAFKPFYPATASRNLGKNSIRLKASTENTSHDKGREVTEEPRLEGASPGSQVNAWLATGAVTASAVAFVALRSASGSSAFEILRANAVPLDEALSNGKPTLVEFYAPWCEVCQELAPTTLKVSMPS
jgi:hypothetical protein